MPSLANAARTALIAAVAASTAGCAGVYGAIDVAAAREPVERPTACAAAATRATPDTGGSCGIAQTAGGGRAILKN